MSAVKITPTDQDKHGLREMWGLYLMDHLMLLAWSRETADEVRKAGIFLEFQKEMTIKKVKVKVV